MVENLAIFQISAAFRESLPEKGPEIDKEFVNFIAGYYPGLYLHMIGSHSDFYKLILANYPSDEQLQQLVAELPSSLPVQALREYRAKITS